MLAFALVGALAATPRTAAQLAEAELDARIQSAFRAAYSLDQIDAIEQARAVVAAAPNESRAHRALASVLWLEILFRRGAVTVDAYLGGLTRAHLSLPKAPADLEAEFKRELRTAQSLAEDRLKRAPANVAARYDLAGAYGLEASYLASVEGSMVSAFLSGRRAFDSAEQVLEREPRRVGAGTIVGTYRYLVSTLALPSRWFAYVVGMGGGKETGIKLVQAAMQEPLVRVEAKTALALIFTRESRHAEAWQLLRELATEFPRNRLFVFEQGSAALRAGRFSQAEEALNRGLQQSDEDNRPKYPGERSQWLYKRAQARLRLGRQQDASADLDAALRSGPAEWIRGRILLEQGRSADVAGRRADAVKKYQEAKNVSDAVKDPLASEEAGRLLKRPYALIRPAGG